MKAIVCTKYGSPTDVLRLREVEKPTPKDNEILIKVHAASINYPDLGLVRGEPLLARLWFGFRKPKYAIPGGDVAGRIEAVGRSAKQFKPGDAVFGDVSSCGFGAFAEYVCAPENLLASKPMNLTFEEAAAVPQAAAYVALQALRDKGGIKPGQKVLICGSSGGIGSFAVQIAKAFGTEVTGVCSTRNLDLVRSIGADHVIDYTQEDFAQNGHKYDLIVATAGYRSISDYKRALSPTGTFVATGGALAQTFQAMLLGPLISTTGNQKMGNSSSVGKENKEDLVLMKELVEAGNVRPVIDRNYPLSETAEAVQYYGEGHSQGKVVITVEHDNRKGKP